MIVNILLLIIGYIIVKSMAHTAVDWLPEFIKGMAMLMLPYIVPLILMPFIEPDSDHWYKVTIIVISVTWFFWGTWYILNHHDKFLD